MSTYIVDTSSSSILYIFSCCGDESAAWEGARHKQEGGQGEGKTGGVRLGYRGLEGRGETRYRKL